MDTILEVAAAAIRERRAAALCTVIKSEGSTPRHVGSKMLVFADGQFVGTVGGGDLEHRVLDEALLSLVDGQARSLRYSLADPSRGDPGVCGGQVEVFVDPLLAAPKVVIIGAGHVGKAVAHLAKWLQFVVVVSDDRAEFCTKENIPDADEFQVCPMAELPGRTEINDRSYLILTTRGSSVDVTGLPALLETPAAYIGVIGSRRRWATTAKQLLANGIEPALVERVQSPMGLELQAETPEEIAVSIMAEVLMLRNAGTGARMDPHEAALHDHGES